MVRKAAIIKTIFMFADTRVFKIERPAEEIAQEKKDLEKANPYLFMTSDSLKALLKSRNLKLAGKKIGK